MKQITVLAIIILGCVSFATLTRPEEPIAIPATPQRVGNPDSGYIYIVSGDYVKSGLPLGLYNLVFKKEQEDLLNRGGDNAKVRYDFNVVKAYNGESIAVPNCFQCHAESFDGKLIPGLGNTSGDFTADQKLNSKFAEKMLTAYLKISPRKNEAAKDFVRVGKTIGNDFFTETVGVNPADMLTALLIIHRDPATLSWNDSAAIVLPEQHIPSDVPAWWLLKKKNAMFYNGFGRGDFGKFLMGSVLLAIRDTVHAREVDGHMPDVLAYLYSLQPPKFTGSIDEKLASKGQVIFEKNCSSCHGSYGEKNSYPNLLIPESIIGTDSFLNKTNYQYSYMVDWYNKSWFAKSDDHPGHLVPFNGYIAPPLDGVWITAPYFHNGSVPTIEAVLNSNIRPTYWKRFFEGQGYDFEHLGWKFQALTAPGDKYVYNTTLPGYGNYGHSFGDQLSDSERKEVIEYLKKL
jgi:mono/diheme cytochrome c family protein